MLPHVVTCVSNPLQLPCTSLEPGPNGTRSTGRNTYNNSNSRQGMQSLILRKQLSCVAEVILIKPLVLTSIVALVSDKVLQLSSTLSVLQDLFQLKFFVVINQYGLRGCANSALSPMWPEQAHMKHWIDLLVASLQAKSVRCAHQHARA